MPALERDPLLVALERANGKQTRTVWLDFETYFDDEYQLKKMTNESYVRDPRFEVLGVGVRLDNQPAVWLEEGEFRAWAKRVNWDKVTCVAHHAHFDGLILSHHYGVKPGFWRCTMSMARPLQQGRVELGELAKTYGVGEKGDELKIAKGKRRRQLTQAEWEIVGRYCCNDVVLTAAIDAKMTPELPPLELWLVDTTVRMFTEPIFVGDAAVLELAITEETERKQKTLEGIAPVAGMSPGDVKTVLGSDKKFAALLEAYGVAAPTKPNKNGEIKISFSKDSPGMQALLEHPRDEIRELAEARLEVKSNIVENRAGRVLGAARRGAIPFYLNFYGSHTGRWSGGDRINVQNFDRGGALRDAILAPPGHVLVVADSGQIEARVLAWLAGERALLETFKRNDENGGDFYSDVGSRFFLKKVSKKETPVERQLSKNMVLGLGFQMGTFKFATELLKGMLGSDPVQFKQTEVDKFGVDVGAFETRQWFDETCGDMVCELIKNGIRLSYEALLIHCAVAAHFVDLYRSTNQRIVGIWNRMREAIEEMSRGGGYSIRGVHVDYRRLVKPNGMALNYPGLHREKDGFVYQGRHSRKHIHGGLLTENVVQSLARDIVAEQALRFRAEFATAERRNPVATMTHDEIVAVVPEKQGPAALEFLLTAMRTSPAWCSDLPLNASGGIGTRYGEIK